MNRRLIAGMILLLPVIVAALFGPQLAPYPKSHTEKVRYEESPEGPVIVAPPSPPSRTYLLGTNGRGQDLLTLLLYGARWTIFSTLALAALKVLIGASVGIFHAFRPGEPLKSVRRGPLNALPVLVFLYFLLAPISDNFPFSAMIPTFLFGLVVIIFGTPALTSAMEAAARELMDREYFMAAKSAGAGNLYLVRHHLIPLLKERLIVSFVTESIATLNLLGQLAIFGVFLGGTIMTFDPLARNSRVHEWAGLTGQARFHIFSDQWILLGPLAGYFCLLLSLHLISEGLQLRFRDDYRK